MRSTVTIPFIGKCLKESGLAVQAKGHFLYGSLAQEDDLRIRVKGGMVSIAVAVPEGVNDNIWFTIESECQKREEFESIFGTTLKHLLDSVRNYIVIRNGMQEYTNITKGLLN